MFRSLSTAKEQWGRRGYRELKGRAINWRVEELGRVAADKISFYEIATFFVIAHGEQLQKKFTATGCDLYFPWGLDNFGWYEAGEGFSLFEIYKNYRQNMREGLTDSTSFTSSQSATLASFDNTTPLLQKRMAYVLPEVELVPADLNIELCEKMLASYYKNAANYGYMGHVDHIGIVCLRGKTNFSELMSFFSFVLQKRKKLDTLLICLFCSVKKGEEHEALVRAEGYKQM